MLMLTLGVDLASQSRPMAGSVIGWQDHPVVVEVMRPSRTTMAAAPTSGSPAQRTMARTHINQSFGWC